MLTIISSIIGFLSSWIPEILQLIRLYYNNKQASKLLNAKIELLKNNLQHSNSADSILNFNNLCVCQNNINGNQNFIVSSDIFNLSVRPVLAYGFFILYLLIKWVQFQYVKIHIININTENFLSSIDKMQLILMFLWSEQDQVFLPMIISAYFSNRMINIKNQSK